MSPKKRNQKLLAYTRVSRMKEGGMSPELQRAAIEAYATAHGHDLVWLDPDLDESGSKLSRPAMKLALEKLAAGEADGIIAARLDRLTRRVGDLGVLLEKAQEEDWNLVAVDLGVDLTTANGKMVANILGTLAEWELDRRREGWKEAKTNAVASGKFAAVAPAGYTQENGHLVPNEHAAQVKRAFEVRAAGGSWTDVANALEGVPTSRGATTWSLTAAQKLTQNRAYLGESRSGDLVNTEAHEPIIGLALFEAAQARSSQETRKRSKGKTEAASLAGLCYCGTCGSIMGRDWNSRTRNGREYRFEFLRCRNRKCESGNTISLPKVERFVLTTTLPEFLKAIPAPLPADTTALEEALADAEAEVAAFLQNVPAATPGFGEALAAKTATVDEAKAALGQAGRPTGDGVSWDDLQRAIDSLKEFEAQAQASGAKVEDLPEEARALYTETLAFIDRTIRTTLTDAGVTFTIRAGKGAVDERVVVNIP